MSFIDFAVKRWQITLVLFALMAAIGLSALLTIPRSVDPHFPSPFVIIVATQPGADPAEMEQTIAKPIEDVLQGLDDIVRTSSRSTDGTAVITAEFSWSSDPEKDYDQLVRDVSAIRGTLPAGLQRLEFRKTRTTETTVVQFALVSETASYRRLEKLAKSFREELNQVPGVRGSRAWGIPAPEVRVAIDSGRMAQLNLPATALTDALRAGGTDLPPGAIHAGDQRFNIEAGGAYRSVEAVAEVPVRAVADNGTGRVLRVRDVAQVGWDYEEQPQLTRFNGKRAIWVTLTQKDNINVLDIQKAALKVAESYGKTLPPDVKLEIGFDQSRDIAVKLAHLQRDFMIALFIVLLTLLPLGFRASLVVMVSVPLSLLMGVAVLNFAGFTLNQLAISGFIIALGLLVDDSIVVTENIARHLRSGEDREAAAIAGTRQIAVAVIGCTAVLLLAFLPLAFLPGGAGKFTRSLPIAVLGTVAASLLVSLTVVPFLASRMLPRDTPEHGNRFLQLIQTGIHRFYAPVLHWSLERPWRALGIATVITFSAFLLIPRIGTSLFPPADASYFIVEVNAPEGASLAQTDRATRFVEAELKREPLIKNILANVGRGNPQVFYNYRETDQRTNIGNTVAVMDSWDSVEGPKLVERLRARFATNTDAQIVIKIFQNGPPVSAPIAVFARGPEIEVLKRIAAQAEAAMRAVPGTRDVKNPVAVDRMHLELGVDADKAALLGVAPGAAQRAVRLAVAGDPAARYRDAEGDSYNVVVRLPMADRQNISALERIHVPSTNGGAVPLLQIARPYLESAPAEISRDRQQRSVSISAQVQPGFLTSKVNEQVYAALDKIKLPAGYRFVQGGEAEAAAESFGGLGPVIAFGMFGILGVLVIEFGRFREVAVVAGVIPLGMFGGIVALYLSGNSFSFTAVIGFIALIGIEIKNSILLVDFTTQLRRDGMALRPAIERAGEIRFLPVLLTSITAIGGLLPLAFSGSGLYAPLAWVIIGGLVSSTVLSRVVTPVMYLLLVRGHVAPVAAPVAAT